MDASKQKRIILWAHSRSVSTAFLKAMASAADTKVLFEPYQPAFYFGPQRVSAQFIDEEIVPEYTFENAKARCEQEYPGYKTVFAKEISFSFRGKLEDPSVVELWPKNYVHSFIMRNPEKAVPSYYRICTRTDLSGFKFYQPMGMKELYQVFEIVTGHLGQKAIVLDSDDLLDDPEYMLKQYCREVGIEFDNGMLHWKDLDEEVCAPFKMGFFENAMSQKGFQKRSEKTKKKGSEAEIIELSQDALNDLEESKIYYEKLKAFKMQPKTC